MEEAELVQQSAVADPSDWRQLRRLQIPDRFNDPQGGTIKQAMVIDVETTGLSTENDDVVQLAILPFEYEAIGAQPLVLRMITIEGDSMEPLLANGDRILIDTSQRTPVPPGIFVFCDYMGLVAERIEHEPNSEPPKDIIKSVNPDYETYERDAEEVHMIGRVVWTSRRL